MFKVIRESCQNLTLKKLFSFIIFLYVNYFHFQSIFVYDKTVILLWLIIFILLYIHFILIWKEERFTVEFIVC